MQKRHAKQIKTAREHKKFIFKNFHGCVLHLNEVSCFCLTNCVTPFQDICLRNCIIPISSFCLTNCIISISSFYLKNCTIPVSSFCFTSCIISVSSFCLTNCITSFQDFYLRTASFQFQDFQKFSTSTHFLYKNHVFFGEAQKIRNLNLKLFLNYSYLCIIKSIKRPIFVRIQRIEPR